ncbi:MAG: aminotransferase class IV, partial [Ignavibacteria bacterium]|nr:aminotransferase class IV [Ignavibacteria bacterium]
TPPVSAGLLPGTFRQWLLDREIVVERVLVTRDLGRCKNLYLINSLRLWRNATLSERDAVRHPVVS